MIVNNKYTNVRPFPFKDKAGADATCFIFPGVTGEIPDSIANHPNFKEQVEIGMFVVIPTKKDYVTDASRATMKLEQIAKAPDLDVVEAVLAMDEKKAAALIQEITKEATLKAIRQHEKRGLVYAAIEKQLEIIDKLTVIKQR